MNDININVTKTETIQGKLGRPFCSLIPLENGWRAEIVFPITHEGVVVKRLPISFEGIEYNAFYDSWDTEQPVIDALKAKYPEETAGVVFPEGEELSNWFKNPS